MFLAILLSFAPALVSANELFESDEILELELEGPLGALIDNKEQKTEYPFIVRSGGIEQSVRVRARGNSRIQLCEFPPLRLNFNGDETEGSLFRGQHKIKLVTHCRGEASGDENLVEEYAAYRIFNLLSDVSYRVRLARIHYVDSDEGSGDETFTRFAFFIEPKASLEARAGGVFVDKPAVNLNWLDQEQASLVYVFQYWIGNTDWSLLPPIEGEFCCHNGNLLEIDSRLFLVPHDFDLSGLVNARYAKPHPSMRLRSVTQRRYRGYCTYPDALRFALNRIKSLEEPIADIIRGLPALSEKDREKRVRYLDKAFEKAEKEEKMLGSFEKSCVQ